MRKVVVSVVAFFLATQCVHAAAGNIIGDMPITSGKVKGGYAVLIAGNAAIVLKTSNGGMDAATRAETIAGRLQSLQRNNLTINGFNLNRQGSSWWVRYGLTNIAIASRVEARAHGTTPAMLAAAWRVFLRKYLSQPPLSAVPDKLIVPMGETREIRITGYDTGAITVEPRGSNADAVQIRTSAEGGSRADPRPLGLSGASIAAASGLVITPRADRRLIIRGGDVGDYAISVSTGDNTIGIPISVRKWAGRIDDPQVAEVTGAPANHRALQQAAWNAIARSVQTEPGASTKFVGDISVPHSLAGGVNGHGSVAVEIAGPHYITRTGTVQVPIRHRVIDRPEPTRLLYSNNPERFAYYGTLYHGTIPPAVSSRLFIHHQNGLHATARVSVYLINRSTEQVEAHVLNGFDSGSSDVIGVARSACSEYLTSRRSFAGCILQIDPTSVQRLASFTLPRDATCTGIFEVSPLNGTGLDVAVISETPDDAKGWRLEYYDKLRPESPAFTQTIRHVQSTYTLGDQWAFISLGRSEAREERTGDLLYGDYGVLYDISCRVHNPFTMSRPVQIRLDPSAGTAAGSFIINGQLMKAPRVSPPHEAVIMTFNIGPGEFRDITIQTMPLAGANYPARIIIGSR